VSREHIVVGIDAGTTKVATLIAEVSRSSSVHIIGVGVAPSRGLRKGVVVNIDEAVESIAVSVEKAERIAGFEVSSAYVGISGTHLTSLNNRGVVAVGRSDRVITEDDVARAVEAAQVINVPNNREILHAIPRQFIVDGQEGVKNPVAMSGYRLDVETHIVTGAVTAIQNLSRCIERNGIAIDQIVHEPLAASEAILTEEEKEMGVALVDIGGGTTQVAVFVDGSIWHTGCLSVGGSHITNDIAVRLRTPFAEAERLKTRHAHAIASAVAPDETVEVTTFGASRVEVVPRRDICEVAEARLQETFQLVQEEIKRSGYDGLLPAGVVLVGGTADLSGITDLATEVLQLPVRRGTPRGIHGLTDAVSGPAYATSVGLVLWGARSGQRITDRRPAARHDERFTIDPRGVSGRVKGWLRAILP
jgi:cell division protein FtsA